MDRFIVNISQVKRSLGRTLKSNMDRFIAKKKDYNIYNKSTLKSNMDRFIVRYSAGYKNDVNNFKIQYG